ncbi:MAG TPA: hypothetical protein VMW08_11125 [Acidimicrobiales bacterium]|nr:hypothetical protein [Acidimicrobiales bacterium]
MEQHLFDEVADVVGSLVPPDFADFEVRSRRWALKLWYGAGEATRAHYEAQVVSAELVEDASVLAIEVGWHAEHTSEADNQALLDRVLASEELWRPVLGPEAVAGPFLGRASWRRLSEVWSDPDLSDPDVGFEIGSRLTDYVTAVETALGR